MKNKELYQRTFSQLHSSAEIKWEAYETMKYTRRRPAKGLLLLAAVVAVLAALTTAAVATDFFHLRDLLLPQRQESALPSAPDSADIIGLSGYLGTPESLALTEWQDFLAGYDVSAAANAADQNPQPLDDRYSLYQAYNREMADKLDEITAKYGLKLHTQMIDAYQHPEAMEGIWEALGDNRVYGAYLYEDGTLHYDGEYDLSGRRTVDYQFMRTVKGTFNEVILAIGDVRQYQEWSYTTAGGQMVQLALSPSKGLLIAELEDSFVTVNVLPDSAGSLSEADLEELADSFDFARLTPALPPRVEEKPFGSDSPSPEEDPLYMAASIETSAAQAFYCEFTQAIQEGRRSDAAELICWPAVVTTAEGSFTVGTAEDLLPYYDEIFTASLLESIEINQYDETRADLFAGDGMVGGAGGAIWFALVEDGRIAVLTVQNGEGWGIRSSGGE